MAGFSNDKTNEALDVPCPACVAQTGERCVTPSGLFSFHPHKARVVRRASPWETARLAAFPRSEEA